MKKVSIFHNHSSIDWWCKIYFKVPNISILTSVFKKKIHSYCNRIPIRIQL